MSLGEVFKKKIFMKGRKELFKMLGIDLGFVANRLLPLEWYDIVHRAYCLGWYDRGEQAKENETPDE